MSMLSHSDRASLVRLFHCWTHQRSSCGPMVLADGTEAGRRRVVDAFDAFLAAPTPQVVLTEQEGDDPWIRLHEKAADNIEGLLSCRQSEIVTIQRHEGELIGTVEPLLTKLLAVLEPSSWLRLHRGRRGLPDCLRALQAAGRSRYTLNLSSADFMRLEGWTTRTSFENSVRDVVPARIRDAHGAPELHVWKSCLALMLGMIDHNLEAVLEYCDRVTAVSAPCLSETVQRAESLTNLIPLTTEQIPVLRKCVLAMYLYNRCSQLASGGWCRAIVRLNAVHLGRTPDTIDRREGAFGPTAETIRVLHSLRSRTEWSERLDDPIRHGLAYITSRLDSRTGFGRRRPNRDGEDVVLPNTRHNFGACLTLFLAGTPEDRGLAVPAASICAEDLSRWIYGGTSCGCPSETVSVACELFDELASGRHRHLLATHEPLSEFVRLWPEHRTACLDGFAHRVRSSPDHPWFPPYARSSMWLFYACFVIWRHRSHAFREAHSDMHVATLRAVLDEVGERGVGFAPSRSDAPIAWHHPDFGTTCELLTHLLNTDLNAAALAHGIRGRLVQCRQHLLRALEGMIESPQPSHFVGLWASPAASLLLFAHSAWTSLGIDAERLDEVDIAAELARTAPQEAARHMERAGVPQALALAVIRGAFLE